MDPLKAIHAGSFSHGPLVQLPCPGCQGEQWFHLQQHRSGIRFLFLKLFQVQSWSVHCEKCKFPIDLPDEDALKALTFLKTTEEYLQGVISKEQFDQCLAKQQFTFVEAHLKSNTEWICSECGEKVPNTFSQCWKCEALRGCAIFC